MRLETKVKRLEEKVNTEKLCAFILLPEDTENAQEAAQAYWDTKKGECTRNMEWVMGLPESSVQAPELLGVMSMDQFKEILGLRRKECD